MLMNRSLIQRSAAVILVAVACHCHALSDGGRDSLSVVDAVRIVLATNPAVRVKEDLAAAADVRVRETGTVWNPTVSAEGSYTYLAPIATIEFGPSEFRLFPAHNVDVHLGVRQQVYDFGRTTATADLRQKQTEGVHLGADLTRTALAFQTIQAYNAVLYLRAAVRVQDDQIRTLEEHIGVMQKRSAAGTGTEFDVLTSEVRVASVRNQRSDLMNALAKAEAALGRLLGRPDQRDLPLSGAFTPGGTTPGLDSLIAVGVRERQEMRAAVIEEESARLELRVAGTSDRPNVNAGVAYGFRNGLMPNLDVLRGNLAASVRVEVPIIDGGKTAHREEAAEAMLRAAQARREDLEAQVRMEVRQAYADVVSASEKVATSTLQVRQAREALALARKKFDAGTITNLDLLDMETALQQADLLYLQSLYARTVSVSGLDRATGAEPWK